MLKLASLLFGWCLLSTFISANRVDQSIGATTVTEDDTGLNGGMISFLQSDELLERAKQTNPIIVVCVVRVAVNMHETLTEYLQYSAAHVVHLFGIGDGDFNVRFYQVNCTRNPALELCSSTSDDVSLVLFRDGVHQANTSIGVFDESSQSDMMVRTLDLLLKQPANITDNLDLYNFISVLTRDQKQSKFILCFSDRSFEWADLFCPAARAVFRDAAHPHVLFTHDFDMLKRAMKFSNIGRPGLFERRFAYGLWYIDCTDADIKLTLEKCAVHEYRGDEYTPNVQNFVNVIENIKPLQKMTSFDEVYKLWNSDFHVGLALADTSQIDLFEEYLTKNVVPNYTGTLPVVLINIDLAEGKLLDFIEIPDRNMLEGEPVFKMWVFDPYEEQDLKHTLVTMDALNLANNGSIASFVDQNLEFYGSLSKYDEDLTPGHSAYEDVTKYQDDEVAMVLKQLKDPECPFCPIELKHVLRGNDSNMDALFEQFETVYVLFWLNVHIGSYASAYVYVEAGEWLAPHFDNGIIPFAAVACHDWPDVCDRFDVYEWPRLLVIRNGKMDGEFKGVYEAALIADSYLVAANPAIIELTPVADEQPTADLVSSGFLPSVNPGKLSRPLSSVVVGIFESENDRKIYESIARKLRGRFVFVTAAKNNAEKLLKMIGMTKFALPFIATHFIDAPMYQEKNVLFDDAVLNEENLLEFVAKSSYPGFVEVTAVTMPSLYQRKLPYVLVLDSPDVPVTDIPVAYALGEIAADTSQNFGQQFTFGYLKYVNYPNISQSVLRLVGLRLVDLPVLICINNSEGQAYSQPAKTIYGWTRSDVEQWLQAIQTKSIVSSGKLKHVDWHYHKPLYDYLKLVHGIDTVNHVDYMKAQELAKKTGEATTEDVPDLGDSGRSPVESVMVKETHRTEL